MTDRWTVLVAEVPAAIEDEVAAVLGGGSLGVELRPAGPGTSAVRVYLGTGDDPAAWRARAGRILEAHGVAASSIVLEPVPDDRWVERWQESLRPIPLGRRFVVRPSAAAGGEAGREPILLVPGMAFGTGEHPTTRMCAAALETHVAAGSRWLDVGTGTGILAIVAARCGAGDVTAVDRDPEAAHVAREVVAANGASAIVRVGVGSIDEAGATAHDGLVANIQASFFVREAGAVAGALRSGAIAVISGFLEDDLAEIEPALARAGLDVVERAVERPWACVVARRR